LNVDDRRPEKLVLNAEFGSAARAPSSPAGPPMQHVNNPAATCRAASSGLP
jgi:hypothetical protein